LVVTFTALPHYATEVTNLITERTARRHQIETYLDELRKRDALAKFRDVDWMAMVDFITDPMARRASSFSKRFTSAT
jgi:hypothetical protein